MRDLISDETVAVIPESSAPMEQLSCSSNGEGEYVRPRMDYLRDYEINIRFLSLGCIVRIGCKEVAFPSIQEAMQEVNEYVANPRMLTDKYNKLFNEQK